MSLPEVMLWQRLRICKVAKFRRQHPVGRYILDFYCAGAKVCIEIDGISHDMGGTPERDAVRDAWLLTQGVRVLRVPARDVLRDADSVAQGVLRACLG
ncbi:endonuclease domain-containing protein [Novosphingobium sp. MMS21-SN21R]|uniref:endonuclease domain-containing protein n=1 Tax=Novosphingobium sp. MMS21-SN21R TaxID=2969298 RepID=UPI00288582D4|nr:endonuclease domain-containing protein [Novosphingobium sp. MMS21-SN21R]MDT0507757.1 endonuclease domain-containing protein [Novosphingobium sp. MMS21-SN21R]